MGPASHLSSRRRAALAAILLAALGVPLVTVVLQDPAARWPSRPAAPAPTCPAPTCPAPTCPAPTCPAPACPAPACPAPPPQNTPPPRLACPPSPPPRVPPGAAELAETQALLQQALRELSTERDTTDDLRRDLASSREDADRLRRHVAQERADKLVFSELLLREQVGRYEDREAARRGDGAARKAELQKEWSLAQELQAALARERDARQRCEARR